MALPGPAKGLAVATVTYINYPSRSAWEAKVSTRARMRAPVLPSSRLLREALREVHDVDRVRDG